MNEYEVTLTVRVQGDSVEDVPALVEEALRDHDQWPVTVQKLDSDDAPVEMWLTPTGIEPIGNSSL